MWRKRESNRLGQLFSALNKMRTWLHCLTNSDLINAAAAAYYLAPLYAASNDYPINITILSPYPISPAAVSLARTPYCGDSLSPCAASHSTESAALCSCWMTVWRWKQIFYSTLIQMWERNWKVSSFADHSNCLWIKRRRMKIISNAASLTKDRVSKYGRQFQLSVAKPLSLPYE